MQAGFCNPSEACHAYWGRSHGSTASAVVVLKKQVPLPEMCFFSMGIINLQGADMVVGEGH